MSCQVILPLFQGCIMSCLMVAEISNNYTKDNQGEIGQCLRCVNN